MRRRRKQRVVQGELFPAKRPYNLTRRRKVMHERRARERTRGPTRHVREELSGREPVLVTPRIVGGLPSLRTREAYAVLRRAIAEHGERFGLRVCEQSSQYNHLHLIVEAESKEALSRGMKALAIRVAKAVNKLWGRRGQVFDGRFHARALRSPREVRNALVYVLQNAWKHHWAPDGPPRPDPFSSGPWFPNWSDYAPPADLPTNPCAKARTWLLRIGWHKHWGPLSLADRPAPS